MIEATDESRPVTMAPDAAEPCDVRLNYLLHQIHLRYASGLNLTVLVGGTLCSGTLISIADWREDNLSYHDPDSNGWQFITGVTNIDPDPDADEAVMPNYPALHLTDVAVDSAFGVSPVKSLTLRFATDAIEAWGFGKLSRLNSDVNPTED